MPLTRMMGFEDFCDVDFAGRARFRPQSPLASDDGVVSMDCRTGYGSVALSDGALVIEEVEGVGGLSG